LLRHGNQYQQLNGKRGDNSMTFFNSRSGRIFGERQGSGEPMLLLPGLGMDLTYYRLATPSLAKDFGVIAVDPRGIGESDKKAPYSVESWAADFGDVVENIGRPVHVVGSSLGGSMAMVHI
jgi:3-oxoadipate enol-lactonase